MQPIVRRKLVRTLLGGAAAAQVAAGQAAKPAAGPYWSRRMDEMTSREVESYIKDGGDLVFIPFGPMSGHGPFIPMGMHAHWANALSVLLAEKANGLVFPATYACFAGATRTFRGTVSFSMEEQILVLKRMASTLHAAGFKRTVLVAGTNPEDVGGIIAARALFDETEVPYFYIQGSKLIDLPEIREMYKGYPGNFGETVIEFAALRILGRERPIPVPNWTKEPKPANNPDQPEAIQADFRRMRRVGAVGWRYMEETHHGAGGTAGIPFQGKSDIDVAVDVLHKCAELALPALESFAHYQKWLADHPMEYIRAKTRLGEK